MVCLARPTWLTIICLTLIVGQKQTFAVEAAQDSSRSEDIASDDQVGIADKSSAKKSELAQTIKRVSDPVLDILNKLTAKAPDDANAAVVEMGDGPDFRSRADGEWTLASEEPGPASRAINQIKSGDPECMRAIYQDGDEAVAIIATPALQIVSAKYTPRAGDPESQARMVQTEEEDTGVIVVASAPRSAPIQRKDSPRYESGLGVDSEAVEIVTDMLLAECQSSQIDPATELAKPAKATAEPTDAQVAKKQYTKYVKDIHQAIVAKSKPRKGQKNEPIDPEEAFQSLIAQLEADRKTREALLAERPVEIEKESPNKTPPIRARRPRAALAIEALFKDAALGGITCRIIDAVTRQLVPAHIRVTDATDVAARAPLPTGAWCNGVFSAEIISGPVKIEVNRGRFSSSYLKGLEVKPGQTVIQEVLISRPRALDFAARDWHLADLDLALHLQSGERPLWFGDAPTLADLILAARASCIRILGVPVAGYGQEDHNLRVLLAAQTSDLLLLPVFLGPRHPFNGCVLGLGLKTWDGLPQELATPETPLMDVFEDIRARGGLTVFNHLSGLEHKTLRKDIFTLFPRLQKANFYPATATAVRLYAANELPFDTVVGPAYDLIALDGTEASERIWFNLLNNGYNVSAIGGGGGSLEGGRLPFGQTFVHVVGQPTCENVLEALKKGHTSISFGPAVFCKIFERDMGPGSVLPADGRPLTLQIQAYASIAPGVQLEKIDVLRNGEVIQTQKPNEGESQIHDLRCPISEKTTAWYMVRVTERIAGPVRRTAWTSPIFFRSPSYTFAEPVKARISGSLQRLLSPAQGTVTALVPGQPPRLIATDELGRFKVELPASGTLIFESHGCEPLAQRIFEHPRVQKALAALQVEQSGTTVEQLAKPAVFATWKLLLSDLEWNISLAPAAETP
ncbi:MAG: CehA/McbA family metallohydrolase [Planctomycetota bacterium]